MLTTKDFIAYIKKTGIAKQNRFNIVISVPDLVRQKLEKGEQHPPISLGGVSLTAQQVNIPGYNVAIQEAIHQNSTRKVVYDKSEGEFDITFLCSGDHHEKKLFDVWKKIMFREDHTVEYYQEYISDITIQQLDDRNEVIYETTVLECYPATVGQLSLDRTSRDSMQTLNVVFNFRKIKPSSQREESSVKGAAHIKSTDQQTDNTTTQKIQVSNIGSDDKFTSELLRVVGDDLTDTRVQRIIQNTINECRVVDSDISSFLEGIK